MPSESDLVEHFSRQLSPVRVADFFRHLVSPLTYFLIGPAWMIDCLAIVEAAGEHMLYAFLGGNDAWFSMLHQIYRPF